MSRVYLWYNGCLGETEFDKIRKSSPSGSEYDTRSSTQWESLSCNHPEQILGNQMAQTQWQEDHSNLIPRKVRVWSKYPKSVEIFGLIRSEVWGGFP